MQFTRWKRRFYILWSGQTVSLLTSSVVQYALLWHLTQRTGSAAVLSLAALMGFLPMAVFGPFTGSLADRLDRRKIMIAADMAIAGAALILVLWGAAGELPISLIYGALFLRALGTAFHQPCLNAVTPLMVPNEELDRCAGRTQAFQSVSTLASPALAALLYALMPLNLLIGLDVLGAVAGVIAVILARIPPTPRSEPDEKTHVLRDTLEGLKYLYRQKGLFSLTMVAALLSFAYIPAASLYPLMVLNRFGGTTTHAGLVETGFSLGMLLGGILLAALRGPKRRIFLMAASLTVIGFTISGMGLLTPNGLIAFGVLTLLSGLAAPFFQGPFMALLQRKVPPDYLGRAMGVSGSLMSLACPLGLAAAGLAAEAWGAPVWFIAGGLLCVLCAGLCMMIPAVRRVDMD